MQQEQKVNGGYILNCASEVTQTYIFVFETGGPEETAALWGFAGSYLGIFLIVSAAVASAEAERRLMRADAHIFSLTLPSPLA